MKQSLPSVRFGEILERIERKIIVTDTATYSCVGVRWYGQGAFIRSRLAGAEIIRKHQWRIEPGDIVYNKLFAWKGAFAVADETVTGSIVSDKFPTYRADLHRVDTAWLKWFFRTPDLGRQAQNLSKGAAAISKLTLNPPDFWKLQVPLPPVAEQRRIVARLEELNAEICKAQRAKNEASEQARKAFGAILRRQYRDLLSQTNGTPLSNLVSVVGGGTPAKSNPFFWQGDIPWVSPKDMKVFRLLDAADHINESAVKSSATKLIEPDAVLVVIRGMILAHSFPVAVAKTRVAINQDMKALVPSGGLHSDYVAYMLRGVAADILDMVERSSHDTRRLATEDLLSIPIPVLRDLEEQHQVVVYLDELGAKCEELTQLQVEASAGLDALIPSVLEMSFRGGF